MKDQKERERERERERESLRYFGGKLLPELKLTYPFQFCNFYLVSGTYFYISAKNYIM